MNKSTIFFIIFMLMGMKANAMKEIIDAIPKEVLGWQAEQPDEYYDRETLYDLIDGGAELYLTYDFRQVAVRRYSRSDGGEIELGIYEMGSAKDAYGIFSAERQDEDVGIGQDSEYGGGLLRFWKGHYFVTCLAIGDEVIARPVILALGERVANAIAQTGERPPILNLLPTERLIQNSIRFFHSHQVLNRQYFLSGENILKLDRQTDAVLASYQMNTNKTFLLLIQYPENAKANEVYANFLAVYLPEAKSSGYAQMENGHWTMAKAIDEYLMIVLEAADKNWAAQILAQVLNSLTKK